jgi:hypothetical protein
MTPEQFCYWLQGYIEITNPVHVNSEDLKKIKDHLTTVFNKVTPNYTRGIVDGTSLLKCTSSVSDMAALANNLAQSGKITTSEEYLKVLNGAVC